MEVTRGKFDRLKAGLDRMNKDINHSNSIREYVIEQKFDQPQLIAEEYNKLLDTSLRREKCKKKHAKLKHKLRGYREKYGDLQVVQISHELEARLQQLGRDIKDLKQVKYKADSDEKSSQVKQHCPYETYELELRSLNAKLSNMNTAIGKVRDLNSCSFEKLVEIVAQSKDLSINLLKLEAKVAHSLIQAQADKINAKFEVVEPKLFLLNEGKLRLQAAMVEAFELCRKTYIGVKTRFDAVLKTEQAKPIPEIENMWAYRYQVE